MRNSERGTRNMKLGTPDQPVTLTARDLCDKLMESVRVLESLPVTAIYVVDGKGTIHEVNR